jgi:hypothetical protein
MEVNVCDKLEHEFDRCAKYNIGYSLDFNFQWRNLIMILDYLGTCRIRLSEGSSKHQYLKKISAITALNTVLTSVYTQTT